MKVAEIFIVFFLLLYSSNPCFSQLVLKSEIGFSKLHPYQFENPRLKTTEYIRAYRVGLLKYFGNKSFKYETGVSVNFLGASNLFFSQYRLVYFGLPLGVSYNIDKVTFGLRTTPSIQIATNIRLGFDGKATYNLDIELNMKLNVAKGVDLTGSFSYGLNPSVPFAGLSYRHIVFLFGIDFILKKNN